MTLQDVADLANVQRPVVSMWRKRRYVRGVLLPFPDPVEKVAGIARFDRDEVVDWLARTGRGNNPEHQYDAPAVAVPDGSELEDIVTLVCWYVLTGLELAQTTADERVRAAEEFDPDDTVIAAECRQMTPTPAALEYVDDLIAASHGPGDALDRLENGRLKREMALRDLTPDAVALLRSIVEAAIVHLEHEDVVLSADDAAVALDVAQVCGLDITTDSRALRRRALIRGIHVRERTAAQQVSMSSLISLEVAASLDRLDDIVLGLAPGSIAIVIGTAASLADDLAGPLQARRADVLRVGNLVAALRLPRGLWREAHRQALAVWICVGGANAEVVSVADLGADGVIEFTDLAADIAGALAQTEGRAYRYARGLALAATLARGPVVPRGVRAVKLGGSRAADHLESVHRATLVTTTPLQPFDVLVESSPANIKLQHRSLGELHLHKQLIIQRGRRIDPADGAPDGSVRVLPVELVGALTLDPFDAELKYPRAARTEPGDVVFIEKPQPRAWVDSEGGAMVACPARILRISAAALIGPHLLATVINERVSPGTDWETWSVPVLGREEAELLETALRDAGVYEQEARRRVEAARELKSALIDGVAAGALALGATATTPGVAAAVGTGKDG
nr:hypothetical protein [Mycobacterium sp. SMC-8]